MEYGKLFNRSAQIVWQNKFLIILGILASIASGSYSGGGGGGSGGGNGSTGGTTFFEDEFAALAVGFIIAIICVLFIIGLFLWAISSVARGGMIASVDSIESGQKVGFMDAWRAGWKRVWTLLGIGFVPAIPGMVLFVAGLLSLSAYGGMTVLIGEEFRSVGDATLGIAIAAMVCIVVPVILILSILRNFAERACMLENLGIIDSYKRGASVLRSNLGEAIILFLIQIAVFFVLGLFLFVPGMIVLICCCLWPLLLVAQGAISAYLSSLWTLAWRHWTGEPPLVEKVPEPEMY